MNVIEEYKDAIIHLINASQDGSIAWTKQNPTTIYYEMETASGQKAIMSIQQVRQDRGFYVFTVKNASKKEIVISIDSSKRTEFRGMLDELYHVANYSIERRSLNFLDDVIRGIKK